MRKLVLVFTLLINLNVFAGSAKDDCWFKYLTGTLNGKTANILLVRYDSSISGYIFFEDSKQPQRIIGNIKDDSLMLSPLTLNSSFDSYNGVFKKGVYKGICTDAQNENKTAFDFKVDAYNSGLFEFEYVKGEKNLFKGFKKSPSAQYTQGCIWPSEKYSYHNYIRQEITNLKKFPANLHSVKGELNNNMKIFFSNYFREFNDVTKDEIKSNDFAVSQYTEEEEDMFVPAYFDKNIFVFSQMEYAYTGGAHGNYGTVYTTVDLNKNRILKLSDVISPEDTAKLTPLLEKYFRKQFEVSDTSTLTEAGLFTDTITVNDNFCLTPGSLMFCYMPYEIGPWAMGEVNIYIPISEVESYLLPEAKSLIE